MMYIVKSHILSFTTILFGLWQSEKLPFPVDGQVVMLFEIILFSESSEIAGIKREAPKLWSFFIHFKNITSLYVTFRVVLTNTKYMTV